MELVQSSLGEQFLRFSKNYLSWFNRIFLLFEVRKSCVFQIFLLRSIKAYLCLNIINLDSVDFSERRPEEVISFFWRSVYVSACLCVRVYNIMQPRMGQRTIEYWLQTGAPEHFEFWRGKTSKGAHLSEVLGEGGATERGARGGALPYWRWRGRAAGQGMILRSSILAQGILWPSCGHQY